MHSGVVQTRQSSTPPIPTTPQRDNSPQTIREAYRLLPAAQKELLNPLKFCDFVYRYFSNISCPKPRTHARAFAEQGYAKNQIKSSVEKSNLGYRHRQFQPSRHAINAVRNTQTQTNAGAKKHECHECKLKPIAPNPEERAD